jgi:hypothetical protein
MHDAGPDVDAAPCPDASDDVYVIPDSGHDAADTSTPKDAEPPTDACTDAPVKDSAPPVDAGHDSGTPKDAGPDAKVCYSDCDDTLTICAKDCDDRYFGGSQDCDDCHTTCITIQVSCHGDCDVTCNQ